MLCISGLWIGLSAEVQAALIGALATLVAAAFGVMALISQVKAQGQQSRAVIAETERRKMYAELYEDAVVICRSLEDASIELSTKLRIMNMEIEVAAKAQAAGFSYSLPTTRFPMLIALYEEFTEATLRFIFLIENRRIIDPRILIFRTAMNTVLQDSRELMYSDFMLHVSPTLPTDDLAGGVFPYTPTSVEGVQKTQTYSNQLIHAITTASDYTEDFLTEMQNVLLGDLFGHRLEPRQPIDPSLRVITLDKASELEAWFKANTKWGVDASRIEAETRQRFMPK